MGRAGNLQQIGGYMNGIIRITDDLVIVVEDANYVVSKDLHKMETRVGKDGTVTENPMYAPKGFFRNIQGALEYVKNEIVRSKLQVGEISLDEALDIVKETSQEFIKRMDAVCEKYDTKTN